MAWSSLLLSGLVPALGDTFSVGGGGGSFMAPASILFLGFGAALFYLKLHPASIRNHTPYFVAWCLFFANLFIVGIFGVIKAANNGYPSNMVLSDIWLEIVTWTVLGAGAIALYQALTPSTGKPDRGEKAAETDRRSRRLRADSGAAEEEDAAAEGSRARARTPASGVRGSNRFGLNLDAEKPDPELEAQVEDALDAEPELVLSKEDELPLEPPSGRTKSKTGAVAALDKPLPPLEPEPVKVKTTAASVSRSRNQAVERPKTEVVRPRSELKPAVKSEGSGSRTGIPATSGSRTGIPVTPAEPVSVPVGVPASKSGKRPAASGIRPAAQSGIAPPVTEGDKAETPAKDQYLEK